MIADWLTCRRRIAEYIEELRQRICKTNDDDELRNCITLLSLQQQRLRLIDVLLVRDPKRASIYQAAWERGEALLNWGWVWTV